MNPVLTHSISTLLSVISILLIVRLVVSHDETLTAQERVGLCLMGAGVTLSIGNMWLPSSPISNPYYVWYQWVWRFGLDLYLTGRVLRLDRHRRNNDYMRDVAREHLKGRNRDQG